MKQLLLSLLVTCILATSAFAGEIPSVGAPAPPPGGITSDGQTAPGDIPSVNFANQLSTEALSSLLAVLGSIVA